MDRLDLDADRLEEEYNPSDGGSDFPQEVYLHSVGGEEFMEQVRKYNKAHEGALKVGDSAPSPGVIPLEASGGSIPVPLLQLRKQPTLPLVLNFGSAS
mmetsp:Transcript_32722/g.76798  ORF Transcript_32722/g.76798 Transcript_32722/m.76798 type:complete len:98 (-) Transcript_32722:76-369(-)